MSADRQVHEGGKKRQEKYMWLGFGNYSASGLQGPINPGNVRADPGIFDLLFRLFGMKDKENHAGQEDPEEWRDPSW